MSSQTAPDTMASPLPEGNDKLAERIARVLEREIIAAGGPVGRSLGNEESLVRRFGVSRWVVREAIALTERDGMTQRRRGRHGGVVVAAPAEDVVAASIRNYLLFIGPTGVQLMEIFRVLERQVFELATERRSTTDCNELRLLLAEPDDGHEVLQVLLHTERAYRRLLKITRHPALEVFALAASQLLLARGIYFGTGLPAGAVGVALIRSTWSLRRRQIEAVLRGDLGLAVELGRELDAAWGSLLDSWERPTSACPDVLSLSAADRMAQEIAALSAPARPIKRADTLSIQIHHTILTSGLGAGDALASESELSLRYGVGRGVLREAIRGLERHGFVQTMEGRHGGLKVGQPSSAPTIRSAVLYFTFLQPDQGDMERLALALADSALEHGARAAVRQGPHLLERLRAALEFAPPTSGVADLKLLVCRYYRGLAAATGNPLFQLMMEILGSLYTAGENQDGALVDCSADTSQRWLAAAQGVEQALLLGDVQQARAYHRQVCEIGRLSSFRECTIDELLQLG